MWSRPWFSLVFRHALGGADQGVRRVRWTAAARTLDLVIEPELEKETTMSSSRTDRPRRATPKGLVWLMLAAIAAFPFPWWW